MVNPSIGAVSLSLSLRHHLCVSGVGSREALWLGNGVHFSPGLHTLPLRQAIDPPDGLGACGHTDGEAVCPEAAASASVGAKLSLGSARRLALARSES